MKRRRQVEREVYHAAVARLDRLRERIGLPRAHLPPSLGKAVFDALREVDAEVALRLQSA